MDKSDITEIKKRIQAATPGPWEANLCGDENGDHEIHSKNNSIATVGTAVNTEFIAHSRTDMSELIEDVERMSDRLQESPSGDDRIDELEESCENFRFQIRNKDQQIADLRIALKLAVKDQKKDCAYGINGERRRCETESRLKCEECASEYYIKKAQEQEKKK